MYTNEFTDLHRFVLLADLPWLGMIGLWKKNILGSTVLPGMAGIYGGDHKGLNQPGWSGSIFRPGRAGSPGPVHLAKPL